MLHSQTAMFAWTSASVPLGVVSHLLTVGLQHAPIIQTMCLETKRTGWKHECWLEQIILLACHMDSPLAEIQPRLLAHYQVSDHSQMMCGVPEVDLLLSSTWPLLITANSLLAKTCLKLA